MSDSCGAAAERVTSFLGFSCEDADPVITLRNPADLSSWTQPVLELLIIVGAVLALLHAVRRLRQGDPTNLALWLGSLVYLLVTEPPLSCSLSSSRSSRCTSRVSPQTVSSDGA